MEYYAPAAPLPYRYEYDEVGQSAAIYQQPPPPSAISPYYPSQNFPPPPQQYTIPDAKFDINTLFIAGLPDDVMAREIHNLFRRWPGFDSCLLEYTGRGNQAVAFAKFVNHQLAVAAMMDLNGSVFDPETGATLHIELAKSNSRRRATGVGAYDIYDKRAKVNKDEQDIGNNDGNGGFNGENPNTDKKGAASQSGDGKSSPTTTALDAQNDQLEKGSSDSLPPCSTLFIANLSLSCTEEELERTLKDYRGFQFLKWQRKGGKPCAFADFEDTETSAAAKEGLRGSMVHAFDEDGLFVEYAKSKMRKRGRS